MNRPWVEKGSRARSSAAGTRPRRRMRADTWTVGLSLSLLGLLAAGAGPVWAFHDGGVASCGGCHVMHNSIDGQPVTPGPGNNYLLLQETASDVCLSCHADQFGAVLGSNPRLPPPEQGAGNFVFLLEDNLNDAPDGRLNTIPGEAAGHNIVAPGHGLFADTRYNQSPGGTFPVAALGCTSCHDPHGSSAFRMLHGPGAIQGGLTIFQADAPVATGIEIDQGRESRDHHSAYGEGVSLWCGNCHGRYHDQGRSRFEHPIDEAMDAEIRQQYDRYDGEPNPTGGVHATAYLPEVPFEDRSAGVGSRNGPSSSSLVMCLTCHRAHASSAPFAGRWDFNVSRLDDDGVESGSWPIPNPYGDPNQGSLCRKCHASEPD